MSAPRLDAQTKDKIVEAYLRGEKVEAIAAAFGVSKTYPGLLAKRRLRTTAQPEQNENPPVPAWVPPKIHSTYRRIARFKSEEDAASFARNWKREQNTIPADLKHEEA